VRNSSSRKLQDFATMLTPVNGIERPEGSSRHIVQLFDDRESLAEALSSFAAGGLDAGETVLLVLRSDHWTLTARHLAALGVDCDRVVESGRLTGLDAAETLAGFWRRGRPDSHIFDASVSVLVRSLIARGAPLRVYGEMVDLLAAEGDFTGAQRLEDLWNRLGAQVPFTLFCGYMAVNFGDSRTAGSLRAICRLHSHVRANPSDMLGSFLLERSRGPASPPREAAAS
jgi:hypothetical protein